MPLIFKRLAENRQVATRKMIKSVVINGIGLMVAMICQGAAASMPLGPDEKAVKIQTIAAFLGVPDKNVNIECPQNTVQIEGKGQDRYLNICLRYQDHQKRCEVTITGFDPAPAEYGISLDIKETAHSPSDTWHTVMQMHSFPDQGEQWRCPPLSVEVVKKHFRAYSRWDQNPISTTSGNHCTESGSSIQAREVINNIPVTYDSWQSFQLKMQATPFDNGRIELRINQSSSNQFNGGNLYNDQRSPYLKLGVYKPAGWSRPEIQSGFPVCVSYKNFKMLSSPFKEVPGHK